MPVKKFNTSSSVFVYVGLSLLLILTYGIAHFGEMRPGVSFERNEYKGIFYVYLYPSDQKVKSYRVPALIYTLINSYPDADGESKSERKYGIEYALMPNGGKITFLDSGDFETLAPNKIVGVRDDEGRWWGIQLTNEAVGKKLASGK